ncbi:hypothetical protein [Bartonella krasnovii]|uniref:Uncharacterized protein n=1 Tax=Bartonella krasnovii TaxID=2267275 RepID=A0ABY3VUQ5_9HYPH|nr:hypothetical protein [Bartonella krasnovii]UNF29074.1 hypothetical protein MNL13_07730 [Bartonella krasnovii]UNF35431.1 hypothetical protein MNL12_07650 [Bartonella krasnovii]UNF37045.1 hypothetical protein MNL11_08250 [Bartonella krasnovii]UNF38745.1 hypothetical protein MNL10_08525 [Bartonella krasnovii]UNF40473.1 hypothetical protein MNL09_08645 [Bartonella krasnovii]
MHYKESIIDFAWPTGTVSCNFLAETILNVSEANVELTEDTPFEKSITVILGYNFGKNVPLNKNYSLMISQFLICLTFVSFVVVH